ncbi:MAG: DUF305 domain-containing protein [Aeromicrobium sp.]
MRKPAAAIAAALLTVVGCGSTSSSGSQPNDADVMFVQMMIPHHEQAIEMAKLADTRAKSQDVKDLADAIEAAQDPEIRTMRGWLKGWDEHASSGQMSHGMPGIMDDKTMGQLKQANGAAFDRLFLTAMIAHHEGAIAMAKDEKRDGSFPAALSLADAIIETQTAEIKRMRTLLG